MTKFKVFKYSQNNQEYLSLILPLHIIAQISRVLVYGEDDDGYQRKPNKSHYNKIKKYALENPDFKIPTSIILGVDKLTILNHLSQKDNDFFLDIDLSKQIFRIVDGQHRIYGLSEAAKVNPKIGEFELNVIIILSQENRRSVELEVFTDINSKARRISIDLAELAKHDYQIKEHRVISSEVNKHIGIKTAYFLKTLDGQNVWQNAIKFDIHSEITLGIIGVNMFAETIESIINKYLSDTNQRSLSLQGKELIEYCSDAASHISSFLDSAWNKIIKEKWHSAFKEDIIMNDEGQLVKIFYRKDYYIQKGLGIKSINPIIGEIVMSRGINEKSLSELKRIITSSKVKIDHWKTGGPFSGFNSESGFSKIRKMILNEIPVE